MSSLSNTKYLDPKADLTFKKVFGTHPDLLISLLNALLPLSDEEQIQEVMYMPTEMVPATPLRKNTIVDVRCTDVSGRQFVVEMQMEWTSAFMNRVLFNASKAYISQAEEGFAYEKLMPVYTLSLINDTFDRASEIFIHNYDIVCDHDSRMVIDGLHFTFVELPKFKPHSIQEKKMTVLWLRFLTEINRNTREAPCELLDNPDTGKALREVQKSAFTESELLTYEKFWDDVSTERTLMEGRYADGLAKGHAEGLAEGKAEGILAVARAMKAKDMPNTVIADLTGLAEDEIKRL